MERDMSEVYQIVSGTDHLTGCCLFVFVQQCVSQSK